ncbi:MAG: hypothetical protein GEU79_06345 [Acidimicrobiia bacterium]|nr:hypothetical protein [Acidimicrobiia bacterium]
MASVRQTDTYDEVVGLLTTGDQARRDGHLDSALDNYRRALDHPCAYHHVDVAQVHDEIHQVLRSLDRYDEAISAKRDAIDAGYRSVLDPEADIAECLLEAGRREEADLLYAKLRARDPEDVWLYNSAGFAYGGIDDDESLRWCLDGIEMAFATGDPDLVVAELKEWATDAWDGLSLPYDHDLLERVEEFVDNWGTGPDAREWPKLESKRLDVCDHCGFDPDEPWDGDDSLHWTREVVPVTSPAARGTPMTMALAWFPATEWNDATERWPDLVDHMPKDHAAYSERIEARLKRLRSVDPGRPLMVAPIYVDDLVDAHGDEAGTAEARAIHAADLARTGKTRKWPPTRNEPCWCGSGRKYKRCCGPTPAAED